MESYGVKFRIFYSWQSDLSPSLNRSFIQDALEKAARTIKKDLIQFEPVVDRDTQGETGSPDIAKTIFKKIATADIFVCDISTININRPENSRPTPNPNVLIELGYALKVLGPKRIILVMNKAFGGIEELPFDLKMHRVLGYNLNISDKSDAEKSLKCKTELVNVLTRAIKEIIHKFEPQFLKEQLVILDAKVHRSKEKLVTAVKYAIEKIDPNLVLPSFVDRYQSIEDEFDDFFVIFDGENYHWHVYENRKLIEYARKVTSLLDSYITNPEIKRRLFVSMNYNELLPKESIEIASVVAPLIEQESPGILDVYFRMLTILDSRTSSWKQTFENQFPGFEDQTIADEISAKQHYIEQIDTLRLEILEWSFSPGM